MFEILAYGLMTLAGFVIIVCFLAWMFNVIINKWSDKILKKELGDIYKDK